MNAHKPIVTKESLRDMLHGADSEKKALIIGRALVVLYHRQTASEQQQQETTEHNGVGFAGCDARQGSYNAKQFIRTGTLDKYAVDAWIRIGRGGFPRICKYARQLDEDAQQKRDRVAVQLAHLEQQYNDAVSQGEPLLIQTVGQQLEKLKRKMGIYS